jgi:hypothetical protein
LGKILGRVLFAQIETSRFAIRNQSVDYERKPLERIAIIPNLWDKSQSLDP